MNEQKLKPDEILARYADGPEKLKAVVVDITEAGLDNALDAASWTIRQIVHHVADGDDIWKTCIKMALGGQDAAYDLQWYWCIPQVEWADLWAYAKRPVGPSLELLAANRRHTLQLVQEIPGAWERSIFIRGVYANEAVKVSQILEMQANHVFGHIEDIQKIRQAQGI